MGETEPEEPDYIVCMDGNFQHRRHVAASVPIPGYFPETPELFMPSTELFENSTNEQESTVDKDEEVVRIFSSIHE